MQKENDMIKYLVQQKYNLSYQGLVICDLREHLPERVSNGYNYQVHCDNKDFKFSHIYNDLDIAVDKFILISNQIRGLDVDS